MAPLLRWPSANEGLEWIRGGQAFVIISERDGWQRAYVVSRDGSGMQPITTAGSDLIARGQVDDKHGWFYYFASPTNATNATSLNTCLRREPRSVQKTSIYQ